MAEPIEELTLEDLLRGGAWRITTEHGTRHLLCSTPDEASAYQAWWRRNDQPWQRARAGVWLTRWGAGRYPEEYLDVPGVRVGFGVEVRYDLRSPWLTTEVVEITEIPKGRRAVGEGGW